MKLLKKLNPYSLLFKLSRATTKEKRVFG